jgi:thiosulfate dehydrogenase [quinone] large subunit
MYLLFRVIFGVLFAWHGAAKLGWTGNEAMTGFMLFIGISELLVGLGVLFGVLSRLAAAGGAIIMIGAVVTAHWPPIPFNGETALLFLGAFLLVIAMGNGKFSLENLVLKKELL